MVNFSWHFFKALGIHKKTIIKEACDSIEVPKWKKLYIYIKTRHS